MTLYDTNETVFITDTKGVPILRNDPLSEPHPGSVVLTDGEFGTAWQRHFADNLWHSTRGHTPKTWAQMLTKRNLVLVYDAEERLV